MGVSGQRHATPRRCTPGKTAPIVDKAVCGVWMGAISPPPGFDPRSIPQVYVAYSFCYKMTIPK